MRLSLLGLVLAVALAASAASAADEADKELTVVPVVGGSSDVGIGAGYVASLARLELGAKPYAWRLESAGAISGRFGRGARLGYLDDYLTLIVPRAFGENLRFETSVGYTDEPELTYFGVGNAARADAGRAENDPYFTFERANAHASAIAAWGFGPHVQLLWGFAGSINRVDFPRNGRLARDLEAGDAVTERVLHVKRSLQLLVYSYGLGWNSRDNEVSSRRGQYHTLRVDLAPGGSGSLPYGWGRGALALRGFVPLVEQRLTLAARGVVDLLFGDPPFFELSRFDDTQAIGGGRGVRGVPAARYYGKLKTFANFELRSELFRFRAFEKTNLFGLTAFFDTGRVWSGLPRSRALDGDGLGLKLGAGLGARVTAGNSFVVRGDVAWSPDAHPVGAYLLAGQMF